jgi:hyaluronate lyase
MLIGAAALVPGWYAATALTSRAAAATAAGTSTSDFDLIRTQWLSTLIDTDVSDPVVAQYVTDSAAVAQQLWQTMDTSPSRTYLWADEDSSTTSAVQRNNIGQLRTLALALKTPGSSLSGNATLQADALSALDWFLSNKYGVGPQYDNWWDWEIGIPLALNDFCVLMYDELSADQLSTAMAAIARYEPNPAIVNKSTATSANLNWTCSITLLRGALSRDSSVLDLAKSAWTAMFPYSTSGDGFYPDGGFIQHTSFSYNGGYGFSLLQYLTYSMIAAEGTAWAFSDEQVATLYTWVQRNYRPWVQDGAFMDMTRGRNLSRFYDTDHRDGRLTSATLLQFAAILPAAQARVVREQVKGWIERDTFLPFFRYDAPPIEQVRLPSIAAGRAVVADPSIRPAGNAPASVIATSMARAVHHRPGFAYAVAMDTKTIHPYEAANLENQQGWYTGEGAVYLYVPAQVGHWADMYWPTADKYRIPGVTRDTRTLKLGQSRSSIDPWAGGAALDGRLALSMGLAPGGQTLRAHKSWFCIDDAIVCLGAGITSSGGYDVETVVENRSIGQNGTLPLTVDGTDLTTVSSTPQTFTPAWAAIDGVCGYVFPAGGAVSVLREDRSGQWTDMDLRGVYEDDATYTRRFITLWIDHGTNPANASYAYVQLPGATARDTARFASGNPVRILSNTSAVQAVAHPSLGLVMATFWAAGAPAVAGVSMDQTGSVILSRQRNGISVAISVPNQQVSGDVTVTLDLPVGHYVGGDPGVQTARDGGSTTVTVDATNSAGRTFVARFAP